MKKLDLLDRKILYELDRNSRQSASNIAKKCRVHKNVVSFRINKLVERGIIKQFVAMISPSALGLTPYKFYLQLDNFTKERENELLKLIEKFPLYWAAKVSGQWDFIIGVLVKNTKELNDIKFKILNNFGKDIVKKSVSILVEAPHYYRNYLLDKNEFSPVNYWIREQKNVEIDKKDISILTILSNNARTPVVEIAEKTDLNIKTVMSRIRRLEKQEIIYDYRISLNLDKIGYRFFKCFISLKGADKNRLSQLREYWGANKNTIHVVECFGDWDIEPEFEVESQEKFYEIISQLRKDFSDIIRSIETINIIEEYSYICLPSI
jgi:DNA-binding Lrp family transcriptional regulator